MNKRKVVVSKGWGAGWSTWSNKPQEVAEYLPVIEYLEAGGDRDALADSEHPVIAQMIRDLGLRAFYAGGAYDLEVQEVAAPYRIYEDGGREEVVEASDLWN